MTTAALRTIAHSRPYFGAEEIEAVTRVIRSRHIAQGAEVEALEREWAAATSTRDAACVGSGLAALRLALHAVGARQGSEVILPAYSCIALFNAVLALGAKPVLADVVADDWTLDPSSVRRTPKTAAIIAVHLFGMPANIDALKALGVPVIEDCAHGIAGGGGTANIASFYATKMIAGGEGGVVASDREDIIELVRQARNPSDQAPSPIHLNDKLTDLEAAIIRAQLGRLSWTLSERAARAERYAELLEGVEGLVLPRFVRGRVWYRYAVRLTSKSARDVGRRMHDDGIDADQPVWDLRGVVSWSPELRNTSLAFDSLLSLPLYPDLTADEQERVCDALRKGL